MVCNKRTGTIIVGILGIISSIIILYFAISALIWNNQNPDDDSEVQKTIQIIFTIYIGFSCLNIVLNAMLIYGAEKRSRFFVLPWLLITGVANCIVLAICIYSILTKQSTPIGEFISLGISLAFWAIVLSFYMELSKNKRSAARNLNQEQTPYVEQGIPTISVMRTPIRPYYVKE